MNSLHWMLPEYLYQPYEVSLETLALCNAACTFCPYPTLERKGARLSILEIEWIIDEMSGFKNPFYFSPFKVNEPFLDRRLIMICERFNERCPQAALRLFTNGSPLTAEKIDMVSRLERVAHFWVSLNETDPERYKNLMALDYDNTARKLDLLHSRVETGEFPHPVIVSRVADGTPGDLAFTREVGRRWPEFGCTLIKRDGWLGFIDPLRPEIPDTPCGRWFEMSILATGEASLCCMDGKGEFTLGNVLHSSLLDIYNQPHLIERRRNLISRRDVWPCSTCTY